MAIVEVKIKGVRGIRKEITIPLNGRSFLIHGDNGTGKSSIERSLRWALLGTEAPTDTDSLSDESRYRRHILESAGSASVKVTLADQGFVEVTSSGVSASESGAAFRNACIKGNPFLRRSEILSFLLSRPVDRFTYLEGFLDLATVDVIASRYADEAARCEAALSNAQRNLTASLRSLSDRLPTPIRPKTSDWNALADSCLRYALDLSLLEAKATHSWPDVELAGKRAEKLSEGDELEKSRAKLTETQNAVNEFTAKHMSKGLPKIGELHEQSGVLKRSTADASVSDLLSHAQKHLETSQTKTCPICGNTIDRERILEDLALRLRDLQAFQEAEQQVRSAVVAWRAVLAAFVSTSAKVAANFQVAGVADIDPSLKIPAGFDLFDGIEHETDNEKILARIIAIGPDQITDWITAVAATAAARINKELNALPASSSLGDLRAFAALINDATEKRESLVELESRIKTLSFRTTIVTKISEALRRARQDVARDTMGAISNTVATYYKAIHPPDELYEATGPPSLTIQRHGRGTAFVRGEFAGREVPDPNWVYSDGHLDTVGICVFLALRRHRGDQAEDSKLMVLDDVVLSIDLAHARRLISLLKESFNDHQIIILTHNGLFAHWCSKLLPGMRRVRINTWTLEEGPKLGEYLSAIELVEKSLADQSAKQIALQVMALMDEWLAECRYAHGLAVPAKLGEQYTLTDIWEPFVSRLKKMGQRLNSDMGGAVKIVDELSDLPAIRNALPAHENEFAREFPRTTMVEIGKKCLSLVQSLYCTKCSTFAIPIPYPTDPSIMHCDCHCIQYVKPSPTGKVP
jgi:hypothetical protein